jgi:mono/diheme cytochrome c family protein
MKLGYVFLAFALVLVTLVSLAGFRGDHFSKPPLEIFPDMNYQDKVKDQVPSAFFADGIASREPIPGTVAIEMPAQNDYWATGKWDGTNWGDGIPVHDARDGGLPLQIDDADMARGRERYTISCEVCHGAVGDGKGIVSKYGLTTAASYHSDRIRNMSDGEIFNTISNGKGQMFGYGYNITIDDRWRIIMYIRALELSQNAPLEDASPEEQAQLEKSKQPAPAAPPPAAPVKSAANGAHGAAATDGKMLANSTIKFLDQRTMKGWIDENILQ